MSEKRNNRRVLEGTVTRAKAQNTVRVVVERTFKHPRYGKYVRRRKNYLVHDTKGEATEGDLVEITTCRPMSKLKRFRLVRVVSHSDMGYKGQSPDQELAQAAEGGEA